MNVAAFAVLAVIVASYVVGVMASSVETERDLPHFYH
jgi:hypothetical protein